jgi:hypothetical protein
LKAKNRSWQVQTAPDITPFSGRINRSIEHCPNNLHYYCVPHGASETSLESRNFGNSPYGNRFDRSKPGQVTQNHVSQDLKRFHRLSQLGSILLAGEKAIGLIVVGHGLSLGQHCIEKG